MTINRNPNTSPAQFHQFSAADVSRAVSSGAVRKVADTFNEGGGSFSMQHLSRGSAVDASAQHPHGGYMVSLPGTEKVTPMPTTEQDVASHLTAHGENHPDMYEGGWADDGQMYLDKSKWHAPTSAGLKEAKTLGRSSGQIGAYALGGTPGIHDPEGWGQTVRLHTSDFGKNDVDPNFRPSGDEGVISRNEYSHPQGDAVGGQHNGQPVTYNHVLDTINRNRAMRARGV